MKAVSLKGASDLLLAKGSKGHLEAPEELQRGVRAVGRVREVSAHKHPLISPSFLCCCRAEFRIIANGRRQKQRRGNLQPAG